MGLEEKQVAIVFSRRKFLYGTYLFPDDMTRLQAERAFKVVFSIAGREMESCFIEREAEEVKEEGEEMELP